MEFAQVVMSRKSIRAYKPDPVSDETVMQLLTYAHYAPSAGNLRPWEFIVVRSPEVREAIVKTTFCGNNMDGPARQQWLLQPPVLVVVCGIPDKVRERYGQTALGVEVLLYQDCGAAIENFLLGAVDMGLASCYVSGFRTPELVQALGLPPSVVPVAVLPAGYADQQGLERPRAALESILHREVYGGK